MSRTALYALVAVLAIAALVCDADTAAAASGAASDAASDDTTSATADLLQQILDKMDEGQETAADIGALEALPEAQRVALFRTHEARLSALRRAAADDTAWSVTATQLSDNTASEEGGLNDSGDDSHSDDDDGDDTDVGDLSAVMQSLVAAQQHLVALQANVSNVGFETSVDVNPVNTDADDESLDISSDNVDELLSRLRDLGLGLPVEQERDLRHALLVDSNSHGADVNAASSDAPPTQKSAEAPKPMHDEL